MIDFLGYLFYLGVVYFVLKATARSDELLVAILAAGFPTLIYPVVYSVRLSRLPARLRARDQKRDRIYRAEIARLKQDTAPAIALRLEKPCFSPWHHASGVVEQVLFLLAENLTGTMLEECQIRAGFYEKGERKPPITNRVIVCQPFSLMPDDISTTILMKAQPGAFSIPHYEFHPTGGWKEAIFGFVGGPGDYRIIVDALSRNTRRATIEFGIRCANGEWEVYDAPNTP